MGINNKLILITLAKKPNKIEHEAIPFKIGSSGSKKILSGIFLLSAIVNQVAAQSPWSDSTTTNTFVELAGYGATADRNPFWLYANQWGTIPTDGPVGSLRLGHYQSFSSAKANQKSDWTFSYGAEAVANLAPESKLLLPVAYGAVAWKGLKLSLGRWKQYAGLADNELGTGSFVTSGNAQPIPKWQLSVDQYTRVPFTWNLLYFKGFYSDGFFENNRPVTSKLKLHNKSLYIRLGKPTGWLKIHGGFNHAVQWGGKTPFETKDGQMPHGFKNYWWAVSGFQPKGKIQNGSVFDNTNRVGNHIASLDMALELELSGANIFLYRQNLVEDGSLFYLSNIKDGLNGIRIKPKGSSAGTFLVKTIVMELFYAKSQGSRSADPNSAGHRDGRDDYYNNAQVRDGWSYYGRGIGSPFITPGSDNDFPQYANFFTNNNMVWVSHLALNGKLNEYNWFTKASLSSNQGVFLLPFQDKTIQFSGVIGLEKQTKLLGGSLIKGALAMDLGKFYHNSAGLTVSIRKNFP